MQCKEMFSERSLSVKETLDEAFQFNVDGSNNGRKVTIKEIANPSATTHPPLGTFKLTAFTCCPARSFWDEARTHMTVY